MTQKDKELLLKDLCARLPYGVQMNHIADNEVSPITLIGIDRDYVILQGKGGYSYVPVEHYKPYLFPMSSMTEEQKKDLLLTIVGKEGLKLFSVTKDGIISNDKAEQSFENFSLNSINFSNENIEAYIDWLNKNHFDYRGLIEKGLALDATNLNIY